MDLHFIVIFSKKKRSYLKNFKFLERLKSLIEKEIDKEIVVENPFERRRKSKGKIDLLC